jgi:hypothetical protein
MIPELGHYALMLAYLSSKFNRERIFVRICAAAALIDDEFESIGIASHQGRQEHNFVMTIPRSGTRAKMAAAR